MSRRRSQGGFPRVPLPPALREAVKHLPIIGQKVPQHLGVEVKHRPGMVFLMLSVAMVPPVYPMSPAFAREIAKNLIEEADNADAAQKEAEAKADVAVDQVLEKVKEDERVLPGRDAAAADPGAGVSDAGVPASQEEPGAEPSR